MLSIEEGVIYTRVSSARQVSEGNGLDSQLRSCQSYAKEKGIKVINAFEDRAISGDKSDRPGLQALLEFLATRNNFTAVIIDDVSRLMRNKEMYYPVKIAIESSGGRLFSVKNDLNDDDPMNSFMEHIMVGVADLERKMNNKRVLDRMKQRLLAGNWVFPAPLGYIYKDKLLQIDKTNATYLKKIFTDYSKGKYSTYKQVKESAEAKLLINPKNGKQFNLTDSSFKKMIRNKIYIGKIEYKPWNIEETDATHEALIDESIFYEMQIQLKNKGKKKHPRLSLSEFPLKGNLICKTCKKTLTANFAQGRSKKYPYYRCNSSKDNCEERNKNISREKLHDQFLEVLEDAKIKKEVLVLLDKVLEDTYKLKNDQLSNIQHQTNIKVKELRQEKREQISKIEVLNNLGVIEELEKRVATIDKEIKTLVNLRPIEDDLKGFKLSGKTIFENPKKFWLEGDTNHKNVLFDFIFDNPLEMENGNIGTASYSLPYRLLSDPVMQKESMVELSGIEPLTSTLPVLRSPS